MLRYLHNFGQARFLASLEMTKVQIIPVLSIALRLKTRIKQQLRFLNINVEVVNELTLPENAGWKLLLDVQVFFLKAITTRIIFKKG